MIFALAACVYSWMVSPEGGLLRLETRSSGYYNFLIDGFARGKLGLAVEAPKELKALEDPYDPIQNAPYRLHDTSYYKGSYYIYFGITPALTLYWPFHAITGYYVRDPQAAFLFTLLGTGILLCLLGEIHSRWFPRAGLIVLICNALAISFATMVPSMLRRTGIWEVPISSAYAFFAASLYSSLRACTSRRPIPWLATASLSYGLAVGARPNYAFGAIILLAPLFAARFRSYEPGERIGDRGYGTLIAAIAPLAAVVAGLALYNYLRFGDPLEFGVKYALSGANEGKLVHFSPRYLWFNARIYLFSPAQLSAYFPYFRVIHPPTAPSGYYGIEDPHGILPNIPFAILAPWAVLFVRDAALKIFCWALALAGGAIGITLFLFYAATNRYMVDFAPAMIILATIAVFVSEAMPPSSLKICCRAVWSLTLASSLAFNMLAAVGHNDLLRINSPRTYSHLAYWGNFPSYYWDKLQGVRYGTLELTLRFPKGRAGKLEPLVTTGREFMSDYLYVYYADDLHVSFGFEHTGYGGGVSEPIALSRDRPHTVDIDMGSLLPPIDHPYFNRWPEAERRAKSRQLRVVVDGREHIGMLADFYDAFSSNPAIGRATEFSSPFGTRFTGTILGQRTLDVGIPVPRLSELIAPLRVALSFPQGKQGQSEPLICLGRPGAADVVFVTYLDEGHIRFGIDHWGLGGPHSQPVAANLGTTAILEVDLGSLPHRTAAVGPAAPGNRLEIKLNGAVVMNLDTPLYHSPPDTLAVGENPIGASSCAERFTGRILSVSGDDSESALSR